jgi:hypothetical protein
MPAGSLLRESPAPCGACGGQRSVAPAEVVRLGPCQSSSDGTISRPVIPT